MRFLRTIQRRQLEAERTNGADLAEPMELAGYERPESPPAFNDMRIGAPKQPSETREDIFSRSVREVPNAVYLKEVPALKPHGGLDDGQVLTLSIDKAQVNPHIVAVTQPRSTYCEEYRSLRTHMLLKAQEQKLQSIVVVSVGPSEGKSITALNLSWLFAQTDGVKALVIDSDLRRPSLNGYLGIESKFGLSDVLGGQVSLKDAIVKLDPVGLYLLPGGEARSDVADIISGPRFKEIMDEARGMFDYVIIDAPPLGIFTDATVLINHADGALLVVRANQTRYKDVDRVLETLPRERILGTILNQSTDRLMDESYYEYGYYNDPAGAVR